MASHDEHSISFTSAYLSTSLWLSVHGSAAPQTSCSTSLQNWLDVFLQAQAQRPPPDILTHSDPACKGELRIQSLFALNPCFIIEVAVGTQPVPVPDDTIQLRTTNGSVMYALHGIIYVGQLHFTVRLIDRHGSWWIYDGQVNRGIPYRPADEMSFDPLVLASDNGPMDAHMYFYVPF
jgi:hypothetical protein